MSKNRVIIKEIDSYRCDKLFSSLEESFVKLGFGEEGNPLNRVVKPGMTVAIKPNWVASRWRDSCPHKDILYCIITHDAVLETLADIVSIALGGRGRIVIADNPTIDADFEELMQYTGIRRLENKYEIPCNIMDLRPLICRDLKDYGKKNLMVCHEGDPSGEVTINLKDESMFFGMDSSLFRGVFDEREETISSHSGNNQLYTFSKTLYDADVFISVPKMKTHQKVGATLNLKGLVGTVTQKNQLVHWKIGYPEIGGDEYPSKEVCQRHMDGDTIFRGAWSGNDTTWRMVFDLYNAFTKKDRKYISVVDGIIAGEGQGPYFNHSKFANTLVISDDLVSCDMVAARYMGLNPYKIKYLNEFIKQNIVKINDIDVWCNGKIQKDFFLSESPYLDFDIPDVWNSIKWEGAEFK